MTKDDLPKELMDFELTSIAEDEELHATYQELKARGYRHPNTIPGYKRPRDGGPGRQDGRGLDADQKLDPNPKLTAQSHVVPEEVFKRTEAAVKRNRLLPEESHKTVKGGHKSANPIPGTDPQYVREIARRYTELAIMTLADICAHSKNASARVAAAAHIIDRGWGKAIQVTDSSADIKPDTRIQVVFQDQQSSKIAGVQVEQMPGPKLVTDDD